jgi:uncharacterized protein YbaA (DUF1428 family)
MSRMSGTTAVGSIGQRTNSDHAQINLRHQWKESHVFEKVRHRDRVGAKVMKDPRLASMMEPKAMPFDVKRMVYGGFKVLVEA